MANIGVKYFHKVTNEKMMYIVTGCAFNDVRNE